MKNLFERMADEWSQQSEWHVLEAVRLTDTEADLCFLQDDDVVVRVTLKWRVTHVQGDSKEQSVVEVWEEGEAEDVLPILVSPIPSAVIAVCTR